MRSRKLYINKENKISNIVWFGRGSCIKEYTATTSIDGKEHITDFNDSTYGSGILEINKDDDGVITGVTYNGTFYSKIMVDDLAQKIYCDGLTVTITDLVTKFENDDKSAINYNDNDQYNVVDALTCKLSVLKGELWYAANYGLPLLEKVSNKGIIDAAVLSIINNQEDVHELTDFTSSIGINHDYNLTFTVKSIYNDDVTISLSE